MKFTKALTRKPGSNYKTCISSHPEHSTISYDLAIKQHSRYTQLLQELSIEVLEIPKNDAFPDACFVEDNVVIHKNVALINHMGAETRRGEVMDYIEILEEFFTLQFMEKIGTLDGGDVIHLDEKNLLISGLTSRTNETGVIELSKKLGVEVLTIEDNNIVHLKSYVSYLGENTFISTNKYITHPTLVQLKSSIIEIPPKESYAANALVINGTVILPEGSNLTAKLIKDRGFAVEFLNMSEFAKCEGALTCLSILF